MVNICNGIVSPRKCYGSEKRTGLKKIIANVRKQLEAEYGGLDHEKGTFTGNRYNDDDTVIARLESANQDEICRVGWEQAIRSALVDCMESDYYYLFEKEY